ncbi:Cytochrome b [hydrothermal vent metagenome]|uniref:Cytochrome b n=1 Tax=hydrothermal vent metagenome TaxID=652676 RepID=A0A3B1B128_9ZZZZ
MLVQHRDVRTASKVLVWDFPVRFFHWSLAGCFVTAWLTRDSRYLDIHVFAGYLMLGLILFRLLWGFIGSPYARFSNFAFGLVEVLGYLQGVLHRRPPHFLGHNPAGSWAIYLLLGLGLLITTTGLLVLGGEERHGLFAGLLSFSQGDVVHQIHELLAWLMLGMVVVHLFGVLVESLLHKENLVQAMVTGYKPSLEPKTSVVSHWKTATFMLLVMITAGSYWFYGYLIDTQEHPYRPFIGPQLADHAWWRDECGSCHLAFHPSLLPARSWKAMMDGQASHFGEDLFLEQDAVQEIESFLMENAAEQEPTEAAWQINRSIPNTQAPLRITETSFWLETHQGIADATWQQLTVSSKANCAACHLDADEGTFEDAAMRIPVQL